MVEMVETRKKGKGKATSFVEHHQRKMKGLNTFSLQYLLASKLILSQVYVEYLFKKVIIRFLIIIGP